jgi:hypothetical protein
MRDAREFEKYHASDMSIAPKICSLQENTHSHHLELISLNAVSYFKAAEVRSEQTNRQIAA